MVNRTRGYFKTRLVKSFALQITAPTFPSEVFEVRTYPRPWLCLFEPPGVTERLHRIRGFPDNLSVLVDRKAGNFSLGAIGVAMLSLQAYSICSKLAKRAAGKDLALMKR